MRGGFGRNRYERPQPGQQVHSYEDALYPPRAYRYHTQQAPPSSLMASGGRTGGGSGLAEQPANAIVLPTIDADAACGPFLRGGGGNGGSVSGSASASSYHYLGRSASSVPSSTADGMGYYPMDAERRPPPRLRAYFDCFVADEDGTDVQTFSEVCRHAEPLNPFHYRELWAGVAGEVAAAPQAVPNAPSAGAAAARPVKAEPLREEDEEANGRSAVARGGGGAAVAEGSAVKEESTKASAATRAVTRAAQASLQGILRGLGVPDELGSMVLLAARVPAGGRLTRKQEKQLRLRPQRRPAPPRPIRRGAKVFVPAYAVLTQGMTDPDGLAASGGMVDVTAAGPRPLRMARAATHQRGAFGTVGGETASRMPTAAAGSAAGLGEFAFGDDDDEDGLDAQGRGGRRGGGRRGGRGDDEGLAEGDIPLIALGRWSQNGGPGSGGGAGDAAAAAGAGGQLDEEAEEGSDEEDDLSTGLAEDDDDDANFSSDGGNDNDSFGGGGDDGNDDY